MTVEADDRQADRAPLEDVDPESDAIESTARAEGDPVALTAAAAGAEEKNNAETPLHRAARRWPAYCISSVLVALAITWSGWLVSGGGLFTVGSPSMGMAAPVGSLVATQPLTPSAVLRVGDIVVLEPHRGHSLTYVHRIYRVLPHDRYLTKGDLNQEPDPWVITRGNVIGTPQAVIPAIGWIYRCAPWMFLGAAALVAVALFVGERQRRWILAFGPTVLFAVPLLWFQPLIGGFLYGSGRRGRLVAVNLVNTGILPVQYSPAGGRVVHAVPGQEVLVTGLVPKHRSLDIRVSAALPWWGWALVVLACLLPLVLVALDDRMRRPARRSAKGNAGLYLLDSRPGEMLSPASQHEVPVPTDELTYDRAGSNIEPSRASGTFPGTINGNTARDPLPPARSHIDLAPGRKRCSRCRLILPVEAFGKDKGKPDGLTSRCRGCRAEAARQRRSAAVLEKSGRS
ncbi:MAG TPA: S26 family signal peptidase [Mycobacteriales bacterium]|nr:S26 family signal peptidase [Mycobacteriales bacterium]